jgi:hypothetical protein
MSKFLWTGGMLLFSAAAIAAVLFSVALGSEAQGKVVNLNRAVIVSAADPARRAERKAVVMLQDEVAVRTGVRWQEVSGTPPDNLPAIVIASRDRLPTFARPFFGSFPISSPAEGYALFVDVRSRKAPTVLAVGSDARGTLFAVGRLLRTLRMRQGRIEIDATRVVTKPRYALRGHQLGYRDTSNTYDAWGVRQFEQYVRDLIVFGANSIELIPALKPDEPKNALMPLTPWEMTVRLSELLDAYDLNVWLWLPITDGDVSKPEERRRVLAARAALFHSLKRVDAVFVPGGDPGDTPPQILMPFLAEMTDVLRQSHPRAEMWVSHQGFEIAERDWFYRYLKTEPPPWLTGIVYGPWTRDTLAHTRAEVPARYRIRHYPDITHCVRCQFPVPQWDFAFAATLGREPINPRPRQQAHIHNLYARYTDGFLTYSDGVNDDVNKMVWSVKGWDPDADVRQALVEYGRYFIADELGEQIADGLLELEENWRGVLATNEKVETTLAQWQTMERRASDAVRNNWRFQQGVFRAFYDAYVRRRLLREMQREAEVYERLRTAEQIGASAAVKEAQAVLAHPAGADASHTLALRRRIEELGAALYPSVGMQLSVPLYKASGKERGAVLDFLDEPLNNREWIAARFREILAMSDEKAKRAAITEILQWEDPGAGGFYDDLGNRLKEPHLVRGRWEDDPGFVESAQDEFDFGRYAAGRLSWHTQAQTLYETPLRMRYERLDPKANYALRVVYAGRFNPMMRLVADGRYEVHGPLTAEDPPKVREFPVPKRATEDGTLELFWYRVGRARGCQVAEVWLVKR